MEILSFQHKGLQRLYRRGDHTGVPPHCAGKLVNMLAYMDAMGHPNELKAPVLRWKAHLLVGDRTGTWALHVTANWRLTFTVDAQGRICDVNLEDYH